MHRIKTSLLLYSLCLATLSYGYTSISQANSTKTIVTPAVVMVPASFADLAELLSPAVVNISSTQKSVIPKDFPQPPQLPEGSPFEEFFEEFMERRGGGIPMAPASSLGSGFIIDAKNGYVITNNHVIRDAEIISVTLVNDITLDAQIIGVDEKTDLAVLKVNTTDLDLTDVSFGDSDALRVGDWLLAIGNPFGLGGSVTTGILSARARDIQSGPYDDYLQTDASINRGNSGGPLFNMEGKVIGINTAIFSPTGGSVGIGFAIPSDLAKPVISQIIEYGHTRRGWLGIRIQTVTEEIAESLGLSETKGALIASINKGGPANKAKLQAGDVVLKINDQEIKTMRSLPRIVAENKIGSTAEIIFWRDNKEHSAQVTIGELEKAEKDGLVNSSVKTEDTGIKAPLIGLTLKPLDNELRELYRIDHSTQGVAITAVDDLSDAAKKGLSEGEIIVEINQQPVTYPKDVIDIIEKAKKNNRKSVLLLVNDNGTVRFIALKLKAN